MSDDKIKAWSAVVSCDAPWGEEWRHIRAIALGKEGRKELMLYLYNTFPNMDGREWEMIPGKKAHENQLWKLPKSYHSPQYRIYCSELYPNEIPWSLVLFHPTHRPELTRPIGNLTQLDLEEYDAYCEMREQEASSLPRQLICVFLRRRARARLLNSDQMHSAKNWEDVFLHRAVSNTEERKRYPFRRTIDDEALYQIYLKEKGVNHVETRD